MFARVTRRQFLLQALILAVLLVPIFPRVFLRGEQASSADMMFLSPPWSAYAPDDYAGPQNQLMSDPILAFRGDFLLVQRGLREGFWPLWNPLEDAGVPLMANCQSTIFYPIRLLLAVFDVDTASTVFVLFKLWLCGITAFVSARLLRLSLPAARFFSIVWMLASYNVLWVFYPLPDVMAWLPILFVGVEFILSERYRRGFFAMVLGASMLLFAGHPETAFTMSLGLGFYFMARVVLERRWGRPLWEPVAVCAGAWVMALGVYAVQLLPFLEYLVNSYTFSGRAEAHFAMPLRLGSLVAFWIPRFWGTEAQGTFWDTTKFNSIITSQQYSGLAVWFGIGLLAARSPKEATGLRRWPRIAALAIAGVLVALLSTNALSFVAELPLFSSIVECYHICFALLAVPFLGAVGLEHWFSRPRKTRELLWAVPLGVLVAFFATSLYYFHHGVMTMSGMDGYVRAQILLAAGTALAVLAILVFSTLWHRPKLFWTLLTVVTVVDLLIAVRGLLPTTPGERVFPDTALTGYLQELPKPCRVGVAEGYIVSGAVANYGIEEWLGYDGLFPERTRRYRFELGYGVWDIMEPVNSIQYYLRDSRFEPDWPLNEMVAEGRLAYETTLDGLEVYRNHGALPRTFLVDGVEVHRDAESLFERMLDTSYDPKRLAVTEAPPNAPLPTGSGGPTGSATMVEYQPNHVKADVDAPENAVLVLADTHYPGWRATIDGEPAEIFPAYYAFRAVVVPAGRHTVQFHYFPFSLKLGLAVSIAALVGSLCLAAYVGKGRRAQLR